MKKILFIILPTLILMLPTTVNAQPSGNAKGVPFLQIQAQIDQLNNQLTTVQSQLAAANDRINTLETELAEVQSNTVLELDDLLSFTIDAYGYPAALFSGINLQVVNGLESTATINGVGNLIVGYNASEGAEANCSDGQYKTETDCLTAGETWSSIHKSGSHNIVGGDINNYSSYGGLVFGQRNTINARGASISGGAENIASGGFASVSGGFENVASGNISSVSGGAENIASGIVSSISGGSTNKTSGYRSSVSGGTLNLASGYFSSVSGGRENEAREDSSSVNGGYINIANGVTSSILGGQSQSTTITFQTIPTLP